MKTLTINDLYKECRQAIQAGYGDRKVMLTNDDECNGTHELFQGFSLLSKQDAMILLMPYGVSATEAASDYIVLG